MIRPTADYREIRLNHYTRGARHGWPNELDLVGLNCVIMITICPNKEHSVRLARRNIPFDIRPIERGPMMSSRLPTHPALAIGRQTPFSRIQSVVTGDWLYQ